MAAVDLALVLAVDGSASVGFDEFNLIAEGMGAALRDPDVVAGLLGGPAGAALASVIVFSGETQQAVSVDWTLVNSEAAALGFADSVRDMPRLVRPGLTAIGAALVRATALLAGAPAEAARQVIDVAGDGRSNDGVAPGPVRDVLVSEGVVINGLCVLHEEADLVASYAREVIGGAGSFAVSCADFAGFAEGMRRKLVREVS